MVVVKHISRFFAKVFKNLNFLFFINGLFLSLIWYCHWEDQYESDLFSSLASKVVSDSKVQNTLSEDSIIVNSLRLTHNLGYERQQTFANSHLESFKATVVKPVTFDLMTARGACGSYAMTLGRLLNELGYPIRFCQMKVNGVYGGHIVLETLTNNGWVVLDGLYNLYFTRPDGKLASFADVSRDWAYYSRQVPPQYNPDYKYEGVSYTNWESVPVIMTATKKVLNWVMGERNADTVSLRNLILRKFHFMGIVLLAIYVPLTLYTLYVLLSTRKKKYSMTIAPFIGNPTHANVTGKIA